MKTVTAIRHIHFEDLGILAPLLTKLDFNINYVDAPTANFNALDPLADDLLVVLGAPIGAFDETTYPFITHELAFIKQRLDANKPMLGICLGAQLIARLLNATVTPMGHKEIGFAPLVVKDTTKTNDANNPLGLLQNVPVLHWHGDAFSIPKGLQSLAATPLCGTQAFQYANSLALQFHLEADPKKIEQWLVGHACELSQAGVDAQKIRDDAKKYGKQLTEAGTKTIQRWLADVGLVD